MKKNNKFKLPVKLIIVILIIFLALFFIIGYIYRVMNTSDYFRVTDVITKIPIAADLSYLKNRNVFGIDLRKESDYILKYCPDFCNVRLVRVLPNRIFVDFIKRKPLALVKLYKYYFVDENGVLFDSSGNPQASGLPLIVGLETKIFGVRSGSRYNIKELRLALNIIKEFHNNKILKYCKIKKIDVLRSSNALFFVALPSDIATYTNGNQAMFREYLEVRTGEEDIKNKINLLAVVVAESNKHQSNIKYIDLRFKEPVIKYKDAK